jgi:3-hydroxyacyl-[acyl-carrier-protein] dehydratase
VSALPPLTASEVLSLLPQQPPFRFLDELSYLGEDGAVGSYHFSQAEAFYAGHFPGNPITPGVILLEAACQTGLVALGIYLLGLEVPKEVIRRTRTLFTEAQVEFEQVVRPDAVVRVEAERLLWRRRKLRARVRVLLEDGSIAAHGIVGGIGVEVDEVARV